jgi:hypothetical protein
MNLPATIFCMSRTQSASPRSRDSLRRDLSRLRAYGRCGSPNVSNEILRAGQAMPKRGEALRRIDGWRKIATVLSYHTVTAVLVTLALMVSACASMSGDQGRHIFQDVPATIDTNARYLFHMHGFIVELQGPNAQGYYGQYRYYWTLEALADRGFVVISEVRPRTQVLTYATTVARQVAKLRAAGVPADHITVTGISKGGEITVLTTAAIGDPDVRFVVMAGCGRRDVFNVAGGLQALGRRPQGRVLSIYDRHDTEAGGCARYFTEAPGLTFKEIVLDVGRGHALFYTPERVWVDPAVDWALGR